MRRLVSCFMLLGSLSLASPAFCQSALSEAEFADIETSCSAEIAAYDRENPPVNGMGATESVRALFAQMPNDRAMLDSLRGVLGKAAPGVLGPTYICALGRRIAQMDGASLLPGPVKSEGEAGPLGLRGAPAPAQTGALAPDTGERYFLKGIMLAPDLIKCSPFCPWGGAQITVIASEAPNRRLTGGMFPGEFHFGDPMKSGTGWDLEVTKTVPDGLYSCSPEKASGVFGGTEQATNIAGATEAVRISCTLTTKGWEEVERARSEKKASDDLLYEQMSSEHEVQRLRMEKQVSDRLLYEKMQSENKASEELSQAKEAVRDMLAEAKAKAAATPMTPSDSGLSAQTDAAINAGQAGANAAAAAGNAQFISTMQAAQQQALKAPPINPATPGYPAASAAAGSTNTQSSDGCVLTEEDIAEGNVCRAN